MFAESRDDDPSFDGDAVDEGVILTDSGSVQEEAPSLGPKSAGGPRAGASGGGSRGRRDGAGSS